MKDLLRTPDDICNVKAAMRDTTLIRGAGSCPIIQRKVRTNCCKLLRGLFHGCVGRGPHGQEKVSVCGPRRWPVARRPFDSVEPRESDLMDVIVSSCLTSQNISEFPQLQLSCALVLGPPWSSAVRKRQHSPALRLFLVSRLLCFPENKGLLVLICTFFPQGLLNSEIVKC